MSASEAEPADQRERLCMPRTCICASRADTGSRPRSCASGCHAGSPAPVRAVVFQPCRAGSAASDAAVFPLAMRAALAVRALVAFTLPCGHGVAGRAEVLQLAVRAVALACAQLYISHAGRACSPRSRVSACHAGRGCSLADVRSQPCHAGRPLQSAQSLFSLPCAGRFAVRALVFHLAMRAGFTSAQLVCAPCRARSYYLFSPCSRRPSARRACASCVSACRERSRCSPRSAPFRLP